MEKFKFTNWRNALWDETGEVDTSMYGDRTTEYGHEELFIRITLKASKDSVVVFRHFLGGKLHEQEVRIYTDTMKMAQEIKKYIENLEK